MQRVFCEKMDDGVDWNKSWEDYVHETGFGFAVICSECGGSSGFCNCAKKQWIEREKEQLGLPHEKMFSCGFCGNKQTFVYRTWDQETKELKDICEACTKNRVKK